MVISGTFSAAAQKSGLLSVNPNESITITLDDGVGTFDGTVVLEKTDNAGLSYTRVATYTGDDSATIVNESSGPYAFRLRCATFEEGSDPIDFTVTEVDDVDVNAAIRRGEIQTKDGLKILRLKDGGVSFGGDVSVDGAMDFGEPSTVSASDVNWELGNMHQKTTSGNTTFTFSNIRAGQVIVVRVQNGGTHTAAWPASVKWAGGTEPTFTSGAGKVDVFTFVAWSTTEVFGSVQQDMAAA